MQWVVYIFSTIRLNPCQGGLSATRLGLLRCGRWSVVTGMLSWVLLEPADLGGTVPSLV